MSPGRTDEVSRIAGRPAVAGLAVLDFGWGHRWGAVTLNADGSLAVAANLLAAANCGLQRLRFSILCNV